MRRWMTQDREYFVQRWCSKCGRHFERAVVKTGPGNQETKWENRLEGWVLGDEDGCRHVVMEKHWMADCPEGDVMIWDEEEVEE